MKMLPHSLALLFSLLIASNAISAPAKKASQPTATTSQVFAKLLCQRLRNGGRFNTAMYRTMADLADKNEGFA